VKRRRKPKPRKPNHAPLTEQALLDAYKPLAAAYVMSISGCSTPEQVEDKVMSDPEQFLPLVTEYGQFPGDDLTPRDFFELPRIRRFLTALYLVAHHGRKGDWRSHAAKNLLQKLVPKRKGGSPTDFHESIRGTFRYALRDAKLMLTSESQTFVMRRLEDWKFDSPSNEFKKYVCEKWLHIPETLWPKIAKNLKGKYGFKQRVENVRLDLQQEVGYDCSVGVDDVLYLHQCAVRHTKLDPRGYAIDGTAKTYGISSRHVRKVVTDVR